MIGKKRKVAKKQTKRKVTKKPSKRRKNPVDVTDIRKGKLIYYKDKPYIISKIRLGGIIEVLSEDGNTKRTLSIKDITLQSKDSFKKQYGFSKLDEPVYALMDHYVLTENTKLKQSKTYLDFIIYTELNGDKQPIPGAGWKFDASIELLDQSGPLRFIDSKISYDRRGDAFKAAQRMIEQKERILIPNSLIPVEENKIVKIKS